MRRKDGYLTLGEVAKAIGVDRKTVWRWIESGKVPAKERLTESEWYRVPATWLDEYLKSTLPFRRGQR